MADTKITGLTAKTSLATTDVLPLVDLDAAATTKKVTWANAIKSIITDTKGNLPVGNGTTLMPLSVGSNGQVLTADSGETLGVKWSANPINPTIQEVPLTADFTRSTGTYADITGMTVTLPTRTGGYGVVTFIVSTTTPAVANGMALRIVDNAVNKEETAFASAVASQFTVITLNHVTTLAGQVVKLQLAGDGTNTTTIEGAASGNNRSRINTFEVGGI